MLFSNGAVEKLGDSSNSSKNEQPDPEIVEIIPDNNKTSIEATPIEMEPVFKVLKGYSLYKHDEKLQAIVAFLRLSSFAPIFKSHDVSLMVKLESLCEAPIQIVKSMKGPCKYTAKWTTKFCATFIIEVVQIIELDRAAELSKSARKSDRNKNKHSLPSAAAALVSMVKSARLKVQGDQMTNGNSGHRNKRKNGSVKTVNDYMIKGNIVHNPNFIEVTIDKIEHNVLCPLCNHRSLVSITTKGEVDAENKTIQDVYSQKVREWNQKGRNGNKPKMCRTKSQILGCVCYTQNCIGNSDGSGCFVCKDKGGCMEKVVDPM